MSFPLVTINLLGWNSRKYLKNALASALAQDYSNLEIVFIDNASSDGSVDFVRQNFPSVKIIPNQKNLGYARGHNLGIEQAKGDYIVCMNPDIILEKNFISQAVHLMEKDERIAAISGKLLKLNPNGEKTKIIDSTGLKIFRSRRVIDRGHGEKDQGQYEKTEIVFGASGALPIFRKKALEDVKIFSEYFDADFENYKEDIDLCWRLNLYGWKCVYLPQAIAYHERGTGLKALSTNKDFFREKASHSFRVKYFSFKNHYLMLAKNDFLRYFILDYLFISFYELKRWAYVLFCEPKLFRSFLQFILEFPRALKKRKEIMAQKRLEPKKLRKFFG